MAMRFFSNLLLICALFLFSNATVKQMIPPGDWKFIADKWVTFGVDRDVIHLGDLRDDFRRLKIRVTDAPLRMLDMKVHFDNGDVQDVPLRAIIRQGEESRVIDLDGGLRHLKKIEFTYETVGRRKGRARVAVWGTK